MKALVTIVPAILSGGSGTRLWPLSRTLYPKQLLPLAGARTMLQETAARVLGDGFAAPIVICNEDHRFIVAEQLRAIGIEGGQVVLEPAARNTAPAAAAAALLAGRVADDALVLLLPSDHVIADVSAFHAAVARAATAAASGSLVTFGITPNRPETGYGYIRRGAPLAAAAGCFAVERFVEKPDHATARSYLADGGYLWNSGMFLFGAASFLGELERLHPDMVRAVEGAVEAGSRDLDFFRLDHAAFAAAPSQSIDYAVMERTDRAAVVPVDMGWNDVGAWSALWDIGVKDEDGNVIAGDVMAHDVRNSYLRSEKQVVGVIGLENVTVVATDDAVLVSANDRAQEVKVLVDRLRAEGRSEYQSHTRVYRPWGWYQTLELGPRFQVKQISVNPGAKLSLQMHHRRAEHWVVVDGTARVTCGDAILDLTEDQSTYIPIGTRHRLENPGETPLLIVEIQSGDYLGEDDIVRFDDDYGR